MKCLKIVALLLTTITSFSCKKIIHIYSPDKSQSLTVITKDDIQYLINGEHYYKPDSNYVKLDISKRDLKTGLYVCWEENSDYDWQIVINGGKLLKMKLDTNKYHFSTQLPTDKGGFPTDKKFRQEGCSCILLDYPKTSPPSKTTVKKSCGWLTPCFFIP